MKIGQRRISVRLTTAGGDILTINDRHVNPQLEVDVSVNMSVSPDANSGHVRIANLSRQSRQSIAGRIQREIDISSAIVESNVDYSDIIENPIVKKTVINRGDCYVEIDAGHDESVGRLFEGSSQWARHYKDGATWYTELQVGDALSTMMSGVASKTFPPGSLFIDVLRYAVRTMALDDSALTTLGLIEAIGQGNTTFPYGFTAFGDAKWIVTNMLEPFGAEWFVDRGQFFVVRRGHALAEPAVFVDFASGLMNTPEPIENGGIRIRSMFRSDIRIGRLVSVTGVDYDGLYRADMVMHRINNRYGEAYTEAMLALPEVA